MKVVLDTNVIISGMINVEGTPAQIMNLLINARITILYDNRILKEYEEVLNRKKFSFKKSVINPILDYIKLLQQLKQRLKPYEKKEKNYQMEQLLLMVDNHLS